MQLPDDRFLLHASKSLRFIKNDASIRYQHFLDVGDKMEWDQLSKCTDIDLFEILLISLPIYQKEHIRPQDNWEIVQMLSDIKFWLEKLKIQQN